MTQKTPKKDRQIVEKMTRHHRKPKNQGGTDDHPNVSRVTEAQHRAYNILFPDSRLNTVTRVLNQQWIDPDYVLVPVKRKLVHEVLRFLNQIPC